MDGKTTTQTKAVMSEPEQIIELISKQSKILLQNHWPDISDFRDGGESIKVGFSSLIQYQGQERIIETTISFGKRVKDSTIGRIDTDQMNLDLSAGAVAGQLVKLGKRRGRPPKNILAAKLTSAPSPDPQSGPAA